MNNLLSALVDDLQRILLHDRLGDTQDADIIVAAARAAARSALQALACPVCGQSMSIKGAAMECDWCAVYRYADGPLYCAECGRETSLCSCGAR